MKSVIEEVPAKRCFLCGRWGPLEEHHIFGRSNRDWSIKYGLTVHLCQECHRNNKKGVHADAKKAEKLHKIGQAAFERTHTRQEFFNIFGRYYLDEEDEPEERVSEPEADGFCFLP